MTQPIHSIHMNIKAIVLIIIYFKREFYVGLWESACKLGELPVGLPV